jgi:hypothetical protein
MKLWLPLAAILFLSIFAHEGPWARDPKQVTAFRKLNACPASKLFTGPCKGWVVNHVLPLCLFPNFDIPANMKWEGKAESYRRDVIEREMCAMKRKLEGKP